MKSFRRSVSWFLVFILTFQSIFLSLPASALAISWPSFLGFESKESSRTPAPGNPEKLVAQTTETPATADFSGGLTKGVGYKFSHSGDFVDFRLQDAPPTLPLQLGTLTLFDMRGLGKVKYTSTDGQIKEEIILDQAPAGNLISFDFSSSDLVAEKGEDGGYKLFSGRGGLAFAVSPPVVWDAEGKTGAAGLTIEKGVASISIDDDFLKTAAYPITVDPTVIAASAGGGPGINTQHNSFYDGTRYWVLYSDNANLVAKSSTDGINWVADSSTIASGSSGIRLSTWYAGAGQVCVAYVSGYNILAKSGTISGTSITWSSASTVFSGASGSDMYAYPSMARDANGKLWVSARYYNGSMYRVRAKRSTNPNSVTAWDASFDVSDLSSSQYIFPQAVALAEGKMYFIYTYNSPSLGIIGRYFDGTSWDSTVSVANMNGVAESRSPAAVVKNGVIYVGYLNSSNRLKYKTLASPYTAWSAEQTLADDTGVNIAFSLDDVANDIYAFYTSTIGITGKQLRQVTLGSPKRKTLLSDILTPFPRVEAIGASGSVRNVTMQAANSASADVYNPSGFLASAVNDEFIVYSEQKPKNVNVYLSQTDTSQGTTLTGEYRTAGGWSQLPGGAFTDSTNKLRYFNGDLGVVPQADWIRDSNGYYALKVRAQNSPTTKPIGSQIVPYQDMAQVSAPYTTSGDPFAVWQEGRYNSFRILFSTLRSQGKRGLESHYPTYAKDLKPARANVNLDNGNLVLAIDGPATPARGAHTNPILTYNSQNPDDGLLGHGWAANIFSRLYVGWTDSSVLYQDHDGGRHLFDYNAGIYDGPPELHLTLTKAGSDFKLKTKDQITYTFDSSGTMKSVADRNGNISTYFYDNENKLAKITDASSRDTSLTWDEDVNRLTKITDPAGRSMLLSYDTTGDLRTITDAAGKTINLTYNSAHNLTGFTNALNNTTSFSYTNGKLTTITDPVPFSHQTKFTYNRTSTEVDGPRTDLNDKTVYNLDPNGLLTSTVEPSQYLLSDGSQWRYRQKITLNTDSITLSAGSDPTLAHNIHISSDTVFNQSGTEKFWQKVDSTKGLVAFSAADGRTALSYAIKDWDFTGKDAFFDIKNTWDADSDTSMYVYYGYLAGISYPKSATDFASAYDTSLKAVYSMNDDPNASTIQDFTTNNNEGRKVAASNPNEIVGKAGRGENFDGMDDYVTVADNPSVSPTGAITLEAWIKSDTGQTGRDAINKGTAPGGYDYDYKLYFSGAGAAVQFYFKDSAGAFDWLAATFSYADNQWHHYSAVFDGDWMRLYIDGALVASKDTVLTNVRDSSNLLRLGHGWDGTFKGAFDELRLSDAAAPPTTSSWPINPSTSRTTQAPSPPASMSRSAARRAAMAPLPTFMTMTSI